MDRRQYLALLGVGTGVAVAGCSSEDKSRDRSTTSSATDSVTESENDQESSDQEPHDQKSGDEESTDVTVTRENTPTDTVEPDSAATERATPTQTDTPSPTMTPSPTATSTSRPAPESRDFSGDGEAVTTDFSLQGGLTVFDMLHENGESNFIVELKDAGSGETEEFLANQIGEWMGVYPVYSPEGSYFLEIDADGDWDITVKQPRPPLSSAEPTPVSGSDEFPNYLGLTEFDSPTVVKGSYEGQGNFIVDLIDNEGRYVENLFNEIGQFEGEASTSFGGAGYIRVKATGGWSIEAQQK